MTRGRKISAAIVVVALLGGLVLGLALNNQLHLRSPIQVVSATVPATPTVATVTPGPGTPVAVVAAPAAGGSPATTSANWFKLAFWILLFGFGAWFVAGVLRFLTQGEGQLFGAIAQARAAGQSVTIQSTTFVSSQEISSSRTQNLAPNDAAELERMIASQPATLKGPSEITVGQVAVYTALDAQRKPMDVTWKILPATIQTVAIAPADPPTTARVTASAEGNFRVVAASTGEHDDSIAKINVVATAAGPNPATPSTLPNVAGEWGTLLLSFVLILGTIILAIDGSFDGAAATLFGAIAGYLFGLNRTSGGAGSGTGSSGGTGNPPATGGSS